MFADPLVRERFAAADRLYARTLAGMEAWFADPAGRTLRLDRVPGWAGRLDRPVELRGGVQGLIAEACAALRDTPRATGACETGFIVKPAPDPAALNLAALAAALEADALEAGGGAAAGARLLLAALDLPPQDAVPAVNPVLAQLDALINPGAAAAPPPLAFATPVALVLPLPPLPPPLGAEPEEPLLPLSSPAWRHAGLLREFGGVHAWMRLLSLERGGEP